MSVITSVDTLMQRVLDEEARKYDLLADTRRMSVRVVSERDADDHEAEWFRHVELDLDSSEDGRGIETLRLSPHALGQMATDLGVPKRYLDRMVESAPELLQTNVHHWMYQEPNRRMIRARRPEGDGDSTARAWLSDRYRRLDNIEIATKLLPEFERLGEEVVFHQASITDEKFYVRAVFPRLTKAVKVGDDVQWGVQIKNSEVGAGQFSIDSFVNRLICTNGLVVAKVMSARHVGKRLDESLSDEAIKADDRAFWLAARDMLRAAISEAEFDKVLVALRETTEGAVITAPIAATERLARAYSLSDGEKETVLMKLAAEGDFTRWGALNAITAAAQTVESFDRQVEMEEIGWDLATASNREWERIAVSA